MIGWQTTKHGRSGQGLEMGGHYHMLESRTIGKRNQKKEKKITIGN